MTIIQSIILGLVEGITEFLPVSSTAHLILTSSIMNLPQDTYVSMFEIFIQGGAILAVVLIYWEHLIKNRSIIKHIFISFLPIACAGFLLKDYIKVVLFNSLWVIVVALIVVGLIFFAVEYWIKKSHMKLRKPLSKMTYKDAFIIGLIQSFALIPGVSRAGAVIIGLMLMKYKRSEAALYSFFLAIPTIFSASLYDLMTSDIHLLTTNDLVMLGIGSCVSFVSAAIFVTWFISYLQKHDLRIFAVYRIALGLIVAYFLIK